MALFRKHKNEWEKSQRPLNSTKPKPKEHTTSSASGNIEESLDLEIKPTKKKRKRIEDVEAHPGAGVKGVSSGLSTIVKRREGRKPGSKSSKPWWKTLADVSPMPVGAAPKGRLSLSS